MRMAMQCDPFRLFKRQVEIASLIEPGGAPGVDSKHISESVHVIVKRVSGTDAPSDAYDSRVTTRRVHIRPADIPADYVNDPDKLIDAILSFKDGRQIKITEISRGDDMDLGRTPFITAQGLPWVRTSV